MRLITPAMLLTTALLFNGCLREDPNPPPRPVAHECTVSGISAPQWVCENTDKEEGIITIVALLNSEHSRYDVAFETLRPSLQTGLTRQLRKKMEKEADDYVRKNGGFDTATAKTVSAGICRDAARTLFDDLRELARWKDTKTKKTYLLTGISREHANRAVKAHGTRAMLKLSPLKQWAQQRSLKQNTAKVSMRIPSARPEKQPKTQTQAEEPPFMVDEPMVEVVSDSFVGINKRR